MSRLTRFSRLFPSRMAMAIMAGIVGAAVTLSLIHI